MLKIRSIGFLKVFIFPNSKVNEPWHICKETRAYHLSVSEPVTKQLFNRQQRGTSIFKV